MKEIKIELRTTIPAAAIHAALAELSDRCVGRTESIAISEQAVALPARAGVQPAKARRKNGTRHAELAYQLGSGKTSTIDVGGSLDKRGITDIDAFVAKSYPQASWRYSLKKAILYNRRKGVPGNGNGGLPLQAPPLRVQF